MTDPHPHHSPANRLALRSILGLGLMAAFALAACGPTTPPPITAGPSSAPSATPSAEASSPSSGASATPPPGQTDTDWGRIWDTVPFGFPVYPGATPAEEAETGPASAIFALEGADAKTIATWMQTELERATYRTEALNGPLEDGSFVLDSIGSAPDCRVEVAVAPLGGLVTVTVRYGAACPNP
jgi:hypothetical protein